MSRTRKKETALAGAAPMTDCALTTPENLKTIRSTPENSGPWMWIEKDALWVIRKKVKPGFQATTISTYCAVAELISDMNSQPEIQARIAIIAHRAGVTYRTCAERLKTLEEIGLIVSRGVEGEGALDLPKFYSLVSLGNNCGAHGNKNRALGNGAFNGGLPTGKKNLREKNKRKKTNYNNKPLRGSGPSGRGSSGKNGNGCDSGEEDQGSSGEASSQHLSSQQETGEAHPPVPLAPLPAHGPVRDRFHVELMVRMTREMRAWWEQKPIAAFSANEDEALREAFSDMTTYERASLVALLPVMWTHREEVLEYELALERGGRKRALPYFLAKHSWRPAMLARHWRPISELVERAWENAKTKASCLDSEGCVTFYRKRKPEVAEVVAQAMGYTLTRPTEESDDEDIAERKREPQNGDKRIVEWGTHKGKTSVFKDGYWVVQMDPQDSPEKPKKNADPDALVDAAVEEEQAYIDSRPSDDPLEQA